MRQHASLRRARSLRDAVDKEEEEEEDAGREKGRASGEDEEVLVVAAWFWKKSLILCCLLVIRGRPLRVWCGEGENGEAGEKNSVMFVCFCGVSVVFSEEATFVVFFWVHFLLRGFAPLAGGRSHSSSESSFRFCWC